MDKMQKVIRGFFSALVLCAFAVVGIALAQQTPVQNPPGSAPTASAGAPVAGDTADGQGNVTGGNPVKIGCIFNTVLPTYTAGQIATVQCNNKGTPLVSLFSASGNLPVTYLTDNADGVAVTGSLIRLPIISRGTLWNGSTWDRQPGTIALGTTTTLMPPAATQTGQSSGNVANVAASASIAATAGRFSFVSEIDVSYGGATAGQCVTATLTGVLGGTRNYTICSPTGATVGGVPFVLAFNPPLSSTAINTQISFSVPALGAGNTNTTVNISGYN